MGLARCEDEGVEAWTDQPGQWLRRFERSHRASSIEVMILFSGYIGIIEIGRHG